MEEQQIVKRKKGRPKKENTLKEENKVENVIQEKKKRGRKKKEVIENQEEVVKQKKKRGRKAAIKYFSSSIRKKIPLTTVIKDNDNYILHIDVKDSSEVVQTENEIRINNNENQDFKQITQKNHVIDSLPKEIKQILDEEHEDDLLSNLIDTEINNDSDLESNDDNIKDLYEKRLEFREKQDEILSVKLEEMHKDETFINKLIEEDQIKNMNKLCIDEKHDFENKKLKTQENNKKKGYFEILYDFIHNEQWLNKTDVCCWWCCHEFNTIPLGLPYEYKKKFNKFMVKGVFCSFACMIAYKDDKRLFDNNYLINYLYSKLTADETILDKKINKLQPAPPRCVLKMFGGELSIDEFRKSSNENKVYKMIEYPMCVYNSYIEEIDIANMKNANSKLFNKESLSKLTNLDDKRIFDAKNRVSQLESTVVTIGNTIDKFIKFS
jgi:hypothetical protein